MGKTKGRETEGGPERYIYVAKTIQESPERVVRRRSDDCRKRRTKRLRDEGKKKERNLERNVMGEASSMRK